MLKRLTLIAVPAALLVLSALMVAPSLTPRQDADLANVAGDRARGAYLLKLGGCAACHTAEGAAPFAGGVALKTQFGTFFGPNITPDETAGIGGWSREDFANAMLNGKGQHGESLYPVFPYTSYQHLSLQDVADMWSALQEVTPSATPSKPHEINPFFLNRRYMAIWQILFFSPGSALAERPAKSDAWLRGQYIVNGPGHCGECHTPRNGFGARDEKRHLAGSVLPPDNEKVPAISTAALMQNGWTKEDLIWALQIGLLPDGDVMGGSMGEVIDGSLSQLTDEDIGAIATYLLNE
ncbi:MAG: c-type cytochrome [Alphaproteobacteria bacterium]|nr:MAG: c-type cytochrome [Alphaproteobacteria bacterium]